ncbi:hypothetical protein [Egicoccus sp. AB-alg6-2]|uniref:hypothetical protein n=1 Tax=Egicoccus sp. AB-alg6-2 TaxID=3242692 RepID=UPI00359D4400
MDSARRWQVASLVTAAASIGMGALAIQRPSVQTIEPIDLDVSSAHAAERIELVPQLPSERNAVIVAPDLLERAPTPATPTTAASTTTPASTATPATAASIDSPDDGPTATASPAPSPTVRSPAPAPTQAADSPDSVDSVDSIDS